MFDFINNSSLPKSQVDNLTTKEETTIPLIVGSKGELDPNSEDFMKMWKSVGILPIHSNNEEVRKYWNYNPQRGLSLDEGQSYYADSNAWRDALERYGGDQALALEYVRKQRLNAQAYTPQWRDEAGITLQTGTGRFEALNQAISSMASLPTPQERNRVERTRREKSRVPNQPTPVLTAEELATINEYKEFLRNNPI